MKAGTLTYQAGDLFAGLNQHKAVIVPHVCNNMGAWGAGFVVPLGRKYPASRESYMAWHSGTKRYPQDVTVIADDFGLGEVQYVVVEPNVIVANMVAQTLGGPRPLNYVALVQCMVSVVQHTGLLDNPVIVAPMFGSGLAGGDWNFIEKLIEDCWLKRGVDVIIHYLPNQLPNNWTPPTSV